MTFNEIQMLASEIEEAASKSFISLFENKEEYYYCTLVTTGEGFAPIVSAWSWDALQRESEREEDPEDYREMVKWSYSDSPYYNFGEEYFDKVRELFSKRPAIQDLNLSAWNKELNIRLKAMEQAMKKLDERGIFKLNQSRDQICILVEVMPPERITTEIALRLNNPKSIAMKEWLEEAAE